MPSNTRSNTVGKPRLIITADDFGRDAACTRSIVDNIEAGIVTATSIMANARHFEEACALVHERKLHPHVGVHLVLDEGPPLAPSMRAFANAAGELKVRRQLKPLPRDLAAAIEAECAAQIDRVIAAGIQPLHLDSHRHIHTSFPIGRIVVRLARRYGIRYVRPARSLARGASGLRDVYKWLFNRYIAATCSTADRFGDIVDFFEKRYKVPDGCLIECMAHLDDSARGIANRRLLASGEFRQFLRDYRLESHAP